MKTTSKFKTSPKIKTTTKRKPTLNHTALSYWTIVVLVFAETKFVDDFQNSIVFYFDLALLFDSKPLSGKSIHNPFLKFPGSWPNKT